MAEFEKTERTTITRLPKRGTYDKDTIYSILDESLFCTLAYAENGIAFQISTGFCRIDDKIFIHGSVGSGYMRHLADARPTVSISVSLMDGVVLARSAFHHSVNYRSVIIFAQPEKVTNEKELELILREFTNKMQPGRWNDIRKPTPGEWKATMVLAFPLHEVSAKIRTGGPVDDEEDYALDIWAGVVPLKTQRMAPIADTSLKKGIQLPVYMKT